MRESVSRYAPLSYAFVCQRDSFDYSHCLIEITFHIVEVRIRYSWRSSVWVHKDHSFSSARATFLYLAALVWVANKERTRRVLAHKDGTFQFPLCKHFSIEGAYFSCVRGCTLSTRRADRSSCFSLVRLYTWPYTSVHMLSGLVKELATQVLARTHFNSWQ
jgi:hypothetical protein